MARNIDIKVQILSLDGQYHPAEMDRVSNLVMVGVEIGAKRRRHCDTMVFDPKTGEPLHLAPYPDCAAAQFIANMSIGSPHAMLSILQSDFAGQDDSLGGIDPIVIQPWYGDDDD